MKKNILGIDIGGTKTAIIYAQETSGGIEIIDKVVFTTTVVDDTLNNIMMHLQQMLEKYGLSPQNTAAIGISCGGPLDNEKGIIMSPPNLPGWDNIHIVKMISDRFHIPCAIQNDANACALAEWKFGAGKGTTNMVFLTFGTGLGAGIIINGRLYSGTNGNAGEVGHIRLDNFGPVGYGKAGSFEGFCSGNGIAQLAKMKALEKLQMGESVSYCKSIQEIESITAKAVAEAAANGDELALEIYKISGYYLGKGLSILIDILNPELIVIGSIYERAGHLLNPSMMEVIKRESLPLSQHVCKIIPAGLGEQIGDFASLSIAACI